LLHCRSNHLFVTTQRFTFSDKRLVLVVALEHELQWQQQRPLARTPLARDGESG
jgi:hypothetical protein